VRGYPRVHELLTTAIAAAQQAKASADAEAGRQETRKQESTRRDDAHAAIDAARTSLARANDLLVAAQACPRAARAREVRKDLETVRFNLDSYRRQLVDSERKYAQGDFEAATRQAETLKGQTDPVGADLRTVLVKFGCRQPE
jgi:hypothetical protein